MAFASDALTSGVTVTSSSSLTSQKSAVAVSGLRLRGASPGISGITAFFGGLNVTSNLAVSTTVATASITPVGRRA